MTETIGNVLLNLDYYSGNDMYSDGDIEDTLLEIVKKYPENQYNSIISSANSWPVLYHLSHLRENCVEWFPLSSGEDVLEIGAGCGAVTGALSRKARTVTCIDLSKKRSMINAFRHKDLNNIEIIVGNFQDIEPVLPKKFDFITLIGVFEYSALYINSKSPFVDMLKLVASHLMPFGKIAIAIENRLGLKYWAGSAEDHTGRYFGGIEGYEEDGGVRTFSKNELTDIINESGDFNISFYYPYPDYKFPLAVYSDDYLPKAGELSITDHNFDRLQLRTFNESKAFDGIIKSRLFPEFSNSFIVILEKKN